MRNWNEISMKHIGKILAGVLFAVLLLTALQSFAGFKILVDLHNGKSRLADSYRNLEKIKTSRKQRRGILWGMAFSSTLFKVLPVRLLGQ